MNEEITQHGNEKSHGHEVDGSWVEICRRNEQGIPSRVMENMRILKDEFDRFKEDNVKSVKEQVE